MSADMQNMLAKLQVSLAGQQQNQPSIYGLQAQQDPNATAAILKKLQDQSYVDQQGNGDPNSLVGLIGNAGKKDFARLGQGIGNLLGVGAPAQYDNSNVMAQRQAIVQGKGQLQQLLQAGVDPNEAQLHVLSSLAQAGVPGAAEALSKANDDASKLALAKAQIKKDNAAGDASTDELRHRLATEQTEQQRLALDVAKNTFTKPTSANGYSTQYSGTGEQRISKNMDAPSAAAAAVDPAATAAAVDMVGTNKISIQDALSRMAGPQRMDFLAQLAAKYPDYNTPGFKAKTAIVHAYTSGTQGQAAIKMENAAQHSDMVIEAGKALDNGDMPALNRIANALGVQTGSLTTPKAVYDAILPIYAAEVNSSLVKGGGGEAERDARIKALSSDLPQPSREAAAKGIQRMLQAQAGNMETTYRKASGNNDFYDLYPGLKPAETAAAAAPQAAPTGWTLHVDAKGNKAYVSPDGKQYQEVK